MGSFSTITFSTITCGVGAAILASGTLTASPAWSATAGRRVVQVPCDAAALATAITAANAPGGAVLRLARRCVYDITTPATAATGLPVITGDIALVGGQETTIRRDNAAAAFRVFDVAAGGRLRLVGISVLDGSTTGLGGGVQNAGTLVLREVTLSGNTAANGGGVANLPNATATVSRTLFAANTTTGVGGGGVLNFGRLTADATAFRANSAPINGGGINTQTGGVTALIQSTVEGNVSGSLGGGLSNLGTTTLNRSVVEGNQGSGGGGIATAGNTANNNVLLSRSVVRDNRPDNCSPRNTIPGCVD
jgi:hypothetical protein